MVEFAVCSHSRSETYKSDIWTWLFIDGGLLIIHCCQKTMQIWISGETVSIVQ